MKLSELAGSFQLDVVRDGTFSNLGFDNGIGRDLLMPLFVGRYRDKLLKSGRLACVITSPELADSIPESVPLAVCPDPLTSFLDVHVKLVEDGFYGSGFESEVDSSVNIHPTAYVEPKGVRIGPDVRIGPNTVVLAGTTIGADCKIGPNVTLGYEGFEIRELHGRQICIPHGGGVVLEERVHVQSNSAVARSIFLSPTRIGVDTKLAHMVFVSHGATVGERCKLAANSTISGATRIGDDVWVGPGVQVSNGLDIGSGSFLAIGAVVINSLPENSRVSGNFATDHTRTLMKSRWKRD